MLDGDGMEEIKQLFFEESDEGLSAMESGLLSLEEGEADSEAINDIFRAAHSLKGGAATFSFTEIAKFTHGAETLLDEMRDGSREITTNCVEVLLKSVDCIRDMMALAKEGDDAATDDVATVAQQIEVILSNATAPTAAGGEAPLEDYIGEVMSADESEAAPAEAENAAVEGWRISFKPHLNFLQFGNKPSLIFRELAELGELSVTSHVDELPPLDELDPRDCHVSWSLEINGNIEKEALNAVFDWVDDDCELSFEALGDTTDTETEITATATVEAEPQAVEQPAQKAPAETKKTTTRKAAKPSGSIRVDIDKIDALLNLVGELVITQSMLRKVGSEISETINEELESGLGQLETNARELQEVAMKMRMLPINNTFNRFPRMVHDLCNQLDKQVDLQISGEQTELDKTVLEKVADPLVHLVRNALDHGIETPAERVAAGKPGMGVMKLSAAHEAGNIVISISDDGAGINPERVLAKARERGIVGETEQLTHDEINHLIFKAGFSTADVVSDVSGRGVGMDVVRRNIQDLGGRVEIESEYGVGSTFKIRLPLTLAILDGQLVRVGSDTYIVPLLGIVESVLVDMDKVNPVGAAAVFRLRDENIPIIRVDEVLGSAVPSTTEKTLDDLEDKILVVVDLGNEHVGLIVDELLDQQQVVIKSLETNYQQLDGISGATILGSGAVALILDLVSLVNQCYRSSSVSKKASPVAA